MSIEFASAVSYWRLGHPVVVPAREAGLVSDLAQSVAYMAYVAYFESVSDCIATGTDKTCFVMEILACSIT